eukprot:15465364-Alexandrium_andersonii.AAC.2
MPTALCFRASLLASFVAGSMLAACWLFKLGYLAAYWQRIDRTLAPLPQVPLRRLRTKTKVGDIQAKLAPADPRAKPKAGQHD